jgi:hypothetical protein
MRGQKVSRDYNGIPKGIALWPPEAFLDRPYATLRLFQALAVKTAPGLVDPVAAPVRA